MWHNPKLPDDTVRTELHLSCPEKTVQYLHDLIVEFQPPFDSFEEMDGYIFVYTSPALANSVFKQLYEKLYHQHIDLIGHPDVVMIEDDVLYFKDCEVFGFSELINIFVILTSS